MFRNLAFMLFLLLPTVSQAQLESQFIFRGQNSEVLKAEKKITIKEYDYEQYDSMCSRQVPYQEYGCETVTRYRQSCETIPSRHECRSVPDRVCRTVTRTRQECTTPSPRQVCTERPTREVCRTKPDGTQACSTVGGGQSCTTVQGSPQCRSVPYSDQECSTISRQECHTIPSSTQCSQVPYQDQECGMQTRYRVETYACVETRRIERKVEKTIKAETEVQILTNGIVEEFPMSVALQASEDYKKFQVQTSLVKQPSVFVVLKKQQAKVESATAKEIIVKSTVVLEILKQEMLPISFPTAIAKASVDKETKKLTIEFEGDISPVGSIALRMTYKPFLRSVRTVAELKGSYPSEEIQLGVVGEKAALSIDLSKSLQHELMKKNMMFRIDMASEMNLQGEILNEKKPETKKEFGYTSVQLN